MASRTSSVTHCLVCGKQYLQLRRARTHVYMMHTKAEREGTGRKSGLKVVFSEGKRTSC